MLKRVDAQYDDGQRQKGQNVYVTLGRFRQRGWLRAADDNGRHFERDTR